MNVSKSKFLASIYKFGDVGGFATDFADEQIRLLFREHEVCCGVVTKDHHEVDGIAQRQFETVLLLSH